MELGPAHSESPMAATLAELHRQERRNIALILQTQATIAESARLIGQSRRLLADSEGATNLRKNPLSCSYPRALDAEARHPGKAGDPPDGF